VDVILPSSGVVMEVSVVRTKLKLTSVHNVAPRSQIAITYIQSRDRLITSPNFLIRHSCGVFGKEVG
jgi:hypothetical protein